MATEWFEEAESREPEEPEWPEDEEWRRHKESIGFHYLGILQGLLLGIGGNLVVSYFIEVLRSIVSKDHWFFTNLTGLVVGLSLVVWASWKLLVKSGTAIYGSYYEKLLKDKIKWRMKWYWWAMKILVTDLNPRFRSFSTAFPTLYKPSSPTIILLVSQSYLRSLSIQTLLRQKRFHPLLQVAGSPFIHSILF